VADHLQQPGRIEGLAVVAHVDSVARAGLAACGLEGEFWGGIDERPRQRFGVTLPARESIETGFRRGLDTAGEFHRRTCGIAMTEWGCAVSWHEDHDGVASAVVAEPDLTLGHGGLRSRWGRRRRRSHPRRGRSWEGLVDRARRSQSHAARPG